MIKANKPVIRNNVLQLTVSYFVPSSVCFSVVAIVVEATEVGTAKIHKIGR